MNQYQEQAEVMIVEPGARALTHKSEIEAQVDVAKRYPRSIQAFLSEAVTAVTINAETAGEMSYALKREGKLIEGPSIRLAEVVATAYGNLRYGGEVVDVGQSTLTARGFCFDMQKNTAVQCDVVQRITKRDGTRYGDDMIVTAGNAAVSKAIRNAIVRVVPRVFIDQLREKAKECALGTVKSMDELRNGAVKALAQYAVTPVQICAALGVASVKDISRDQIAELSSMYTSIRSGEAEAGDMFPNPEADKAPAEGAADKPTTAAGKARAAAAGSKKPAAPAPVAPEAVEPAQAPTGAVGADGTATCANTECAKVMGPDADRFYSSDGDCCSAGCADFVNSAI